MAFFVAAKMLSKEHSSTCVRLAETLSLKEALSWIKDLKDAENPY